MDDDQKNQVSEIALEEWEKELDKELESFKEIVEEPSSLEAISEPTNKYFQLLQSHIEKFLNFPSADLGEEILNDIQELVSQTKADTQTYLQIIANLVKALIKSQEVKELLSLIKDNLPLIFSNGVKDTEKHQLIQSIISRYQELKGSSSSSSKKIAPLSDGLIKEIASVVEGKFHEINIKIEENQRALHRLLSIFEQPSKSSSSLEGFEVAELPFGKKEQELTKVVILYLNGNKYALRADWIINKYSLSPKKAIKLAKKSLIKFGQLGSFFRPITKGLKGDLKNKKASDLKNTFLYVLQPIDNNKKLKIALVVKIPDTEDYGVVFVSKVSEKPIEARIYANEVIIEDERIPVLDIKELWTQKQSELGVI